MKRPTARDLDLARRRLAELTGVVEPLVIAADELGLIVHVDPRLARTLGWRADELIGQPLTAIIPPRFRDAHHIGFSRFVTTGESTLLDRPVQLWIATRDGVERRVEHVITANRVPDGWLFAAAIRAEAGDGA